MRRTHLLILTFSHFHILTFSHFLILMFSHFLILECDFFFGGVAGAVGGGEGDFGACEGGVVCGGVVFPFAFDEGCAAFFEGGVVGGGDFDFDTDDFEGIGYFDDDFLVGGVAGVGGVVYVGDLGWA